jgi:hypothetical protein
MSHVVGTPLNILGIRIDIRHRVCGNKQNSPLERSKEVQSVNEQVRDDIRVYAQREERIREEANLVVPSS